MDWSKFVGGMAFYHGDGLVSAWKQAKKFAGPKGRLATLLDVVDARFASDIDEVPWRMYFTTTSAEYVGFSKTGKRVIIVAHGIGPMATLDGIVAAYRYQFDDQTRDTKGGRITEQQFWDLEAGKFGPVSVIDFDVYMARYQYTFIQTLRASEALTDPLIRARFGVMTEEYLKAHIAFSRKWHARKALETPENKYGTPEDIFKRYLERRLTQHLRDAREDSDPYILSSGSSMYRYAKVEKGLAMAHLLSVGQMCNQHHEGNESFTNDVSTHGWNDGTRFIAIPSSTRLKRIHGGPNAGSLLHDHWERLFKPLSKPAQLGFSAMMKLDDSRREFFTQYPKVGESMDTHDPEFLITQACPVGGRKTFTTMIHGYYGLFKYGLKDVERIAPPGTNAYIVVGAPEVVDEHHQKCEIQFYDITADTSRRLMKSDQLAKNYSLMMELIALEEKGNS